MVHILSLCNDASNAPEYPINETDDITKSQVHAPLFNVKMLGAYIKCVAKILMKIFVDFMGQSKAAKITSHKNFKFIIDFIQEIFY